MKTLILILTSLIFISISTNALASEYEFKLYFGSVSHHNKKSGNETDYNQNHKSIGFGINGFEIETHINSHDKRAYMASYHYEYDVTTNFSVGVRSGVVTGYKGVESIVIGGVTPVIQPTVSIYPFNDHVGVELGYLPAFNDNLSGIYTAQFVGKF